MPLKTCSYCGRENQDDAANCCGCGMTEFSIPIPPSSSQPLDAETTVQLSEIVPDESPAGEHALCPSCLFPNLPEAPWCKRCGAPISASAMFAPIESAYIVGFAYRAALQGWPRPFVLFGTWLIFLPSVAINLTMIFALLYSHASGYVTVALLWLCTGYCAMSASMIYRVTSNYLTIPKPRLDEADAEIAPPPP
jgi:hypothetical protein